MITIEIRLFEKTTPLIAILEYLKKTLYLKLSLGFRVSDIRMHR
ncbi:hypothetical protein QWZ16_20460 [Vibrio ostreicida]|uniref:Uncharacterized protein n=1 Tax=Vibrio ostreicida TaxID=526588 RepID=A0ABT8BZ64_9VIBR|nr:hypothetical protein [Vibrio ostreicida]MDN3611968.1 hypothetical protein [Vibrio ostreicida]